MRCRHSLWAYALHFIRIARTRDENNIKYAKVCAVLVHTFLNLDIFGAQNFNCYLCSSCCCCCSCFCFWKNNLVGWVDACMHAYTRMHAQKCNELFGILVWVHSRTSACICACRACICCFSENIFCDEICIDFNRRWRCVYVYAMHWDERYDISCSSFALK